MDFFELVKGRDLLTSNDIRQAAEDGRRELRYLRGKLDECADLIERQNQVIEQQIEIINRLRGEQ